MGNEGKFRWLKRLFLVLLLGAAAAGAWWYFKGRGESPPEYQTTAVTRGNLTQVVTATGQLGPVLNVQVGSQISGIVKHLFIDYNSTVKSNQVIAEIDPSTYQINVMRAQAQLANSKANLSLAQVQARRSDELFQSKLISASDHDTAQAQLEQAQAQVQSDEANLKNAQVQLSYCTIYAPVDGVVISRNVDVGQTVAASFNTPTIAVIANDLTKMQIDALVSEADIGGVAVGQNVNFGVDAYPYRTFHGQVSQIRYGAITNQNVINYDCVIGVQNNDLKLLPGMTANVSIITAERNEVLKIPNAALRFRPPEQVGGSRTNMSFQATGQPGAGAGQFAGQGGGRRGDAGERSGGGGRSGNGSRAERGSGGGAGGVGSKGARPERQVTRTVYVLARGLDAKHEATLKPVQIKVGISDGVSTEVLSGLEEGEQVVTGMIVTGENGPAGGPARSPFGGGFRRF
ncbi:MAG TPA: efflux RND transporter periplasmic adaptor subunit [Verrucomicrobiae bacterium]|nr:efflux RND transporter periplasmic adaptor subunit [Verrucomicrobiae bacterium]